MLKFAQRKMEPQNTCCGDLTDDDKVIEIINLIDDEEREENPSEVIHSGAIEDEEKERFLPDKKGEACWTIKQSGSIQRRNKFL